MRTLLISVWGSACVVFVYLREANQSFTIAVLSIHRLCSKTEEPLFLFKLRWINIHLFIIAVFTMSDHIFENSTFYFYFLWSLAMVLIRAIFLFKFSISFSFRERAVDSDDHSKISLSWSSIKSFDVWLNFMAYQVL